MTFQDFADLVRTMRRDQLQFALNRTSAAAMKARYSETQVDDALAGISPALPDVSVSSAVGYDGHLIIEGQS